MWWPSRASTCGAPARAGSRRGSNGSARLFDDLATSGVTEVCFAGAMARPGSTPRRFDDVTKALMPRLMAAMAQGRRRAPARYRGGLRGPRHLPSWAPMRCAPTWWRRPDALRVEPLPERCGPRACGARRAGAARRGAGRRLPRAGRCWGSKRFRAPTRCSISWRAPRPRQRRRAGQTAQAGAGPSLRHAGHRPGHGAPAAAAGLCGIEIAAGAVLLLDRDAVLAACAETGLSLWAAP
jgi:hypothetical protein